MKTIKEFCNHDPSIAIEAMIRGFLRHGSITNFRLNLDFDVSWEGRECYGSAATLTLLELLDYSFVPPEFESDFSRATELGTVHHDLIKFEAAIVLFSKGFPQALAEYFCISSNQVVDAGWKLENGNWPRQILQVIKFWESFTEQKFHIEKLSVHQRWRKATRQQTITS
jgi:hypothetical protein